MEVTKQNILDTLNEEQQQPVINYFGSQFVVAGPGAGKTHVIVSRTQYMILDGVNPSNILLFTFTNKAAKEIKKRIADKMGVDIASKITMGTYHSFCCRILRQYVSEDVLGFNTNFSIFDIDDSKKVLIKVKEDNMDERELSDYISKKKHKMISPQKAMENINDPFAKCYGKYQDELWKQNAMDFDDLIYNCIKLLELYPHIKEKVNSKYKYISADEYHDSSSADIRLIQLLAGEEQNVCFILDDNQSIYGFRGADLRAVLNIDKIFPELKTFLLNRNYRSTDMIVNASKSLIKKNTKQIKKEIFTENEKGDPVIYIEEADPNYEALRVIKTIQLVRKKYNYNYKDIAILYRTATQSRPVEEMLLKYEMPYEILSGINFFERKEIKDIVSIISVINNSYNIERFSRIVNIPKRGIGAVTIEKIINESRSDIVNIDLITATRNLLERGEIKGKAKTGLTQFIEFIDYIRSVMDDLTIQELIANIIEKSNYYEYLKSEDEEKYEDKVGNIVELIELSYNYNTIEEFLEKACLDRKEEENSDDKVQLLTMHMSKGLEYPCVFIIGCNEGTCPHIRSMAFESQIEEERRLFYVGMTRAEKNLFLLRPKRVMFNGFYSNARQSRFISEISDNYLYKS